MEHIKVTSVILEHKDPYKCKNCGRDVLFTPVDITGMWICSHCDKKSQVVTGEELDSMYEFAVDTV